MAKLAEAVTLGKNHEAVKLASRLMANGVSEQEIITEGLTKALEALDVKCSVMEFNLLEILLAGRAMTDVMDKVVRPRLFAAGNVYFLNQPVIVLGTIRGDIHDLGKRIVATVFTAAGFRVVDLGIDVAPEEFVLAAGREHASFIGVSSLLTVTIPEIYRIKELIFKRSLSGVEVIAGGAAICRMSREYLNVDFVALDVMAAWRYAKEKTGGNS